MNKNDIAKELADLGKEEVSLEVEEAKLASAMAENRRARRRLNKRRCELLSEVARHKDAGLAPDTVALAALPKTRPQDD